MTHAVLVLMLALPALQDDPQVVYREALFEEVDQGNPDKALELYGKILKGGAPDALKAKALYRSGHCHEKKGRKPDAERAYRDVLERFPGEAATAKLARERMGALAGEGASPTSFESSIQVLILDLGSDDDKTRNEAIRRLVLIADPAIREVRRALEHKDPRLTLGAARVLMQLQLKDGLYEYVMAALSRYSYPTQEDAAVLGVLVSGRPEDRRKFLKDNAIVSESMVTGSIAWALCSLDDPACMKLVEDWLVHPKVGYEHPHTPWLSAFSNWHRKQDAASLSRLVERLSALEAPQYPKLFALLGWMDIKPARVEGFQKAVLTALTRHPDPANAFHTVWSSAWLRKLVKAQDFMSGPFTTWFDRGSPEFQKTLIDYAAATARSVSPGDEYVMGSRRFLHDRMALPTEPWATRIAIFEQSLDPINANEGEKVASFGLDYLREFGGKPDSSRERMMDVLSRTLWRIPPDSKDLPAVLDAAFNWYPDGGNRFDGQWIKSSRAAVVAAALRALKRKAPGVSLAVRTIGELGTGEEKVELGPFLPSLPTSKEYNIGVNCYCAGLKELPEAARADAWKSFRKLYDQATPDLKASLAGGIRQWADPRADEFMKEALNSDLEAVRQFAIIHWGHRKSEEGVTLLIRTLDTSSDSNRITAIHYLGELRALEAVPALIRFLEGSPGSLREQASTALTLIRKHYEERLEWQRWYDEMKKTLKK